MGFEDLIAEVPQSYRKYYLKYGELRDLVCDYAKETSQTSMQRSRMHSEDLMTVGLRPLGRFQAELQKELQKVNQFACMKHESLFLELRQLCDTCKKLGQSVRDAGLDNSVVAAKLQNTSAAIEQMGEEVVELDSYVRLNYIGFQKLTRRFDACFNVSSTSLFVAGLHSEPFCNIRFDDILILLGLAWARWRAAQHAEQTKDATWKPPESFIRNTAKYWVRPDQVIKLKTRIVKHLPYLIFGASMTEQEKLLDPFHLLNLEYEGFDVQSAERAYSGTMEESQLLSSVYFDSPSADSYQERIHRRESARLVRFRWYGENSFEPDKEIYVERKVHHEGFGAAQSAKERCILPQKDIFSYMKGDFDIDGFYDRLAAGGKTSAKSIKNMKGICVEVDEMIKRMKLQPIIRTSYYRSAFQLATSNDVRVSLDTQMSLLNEFRKDGHTTEPWCHTSMDLLAKTEIYRFPFAILEIKLQDVSETPLWLRKTLADIEAIQVHKFSKFQHAMAFLHAEKVPILPHWHEDFQKWHEHNETLQRRRRRDSEDDQSLVPHVRAGRAPGGEGHMLKDMQNLDPKAVFANERTMLHYAEKGIYVGGVAVVLLHQSDDSRKMALGAVLSVGTCIYYVWVLAQYYSRLDRILGRSKAGKDLSLRLDLSYGPSVLGALTMLVVAISVTQGLMKHF